MDTNMWFGEEVSRIASERNALRDEVSELKRKLAEVEGERDALRALNAEMLSALQSCVSAIRYEGGNVDDLYKLFAKAERINSPVK